MSIEGLWTTDFFSNYGAGAGVIVFETERIFGGDSSMYYIGSYEVKNGKLTGEARVRVHHRIPGVHSITLVDDFTCKLTAVLSGEAMHMTGEVISPPGINLPIKGNLKKLAELP